MNHLVNQLQTTENVKSIMNLFDRNHFCIHKYESYTDKPSQLFSGQTISAPHMHAKAIEYLEPVLKPGASILDIGSGSGYLTACFGEAVKVYHNDEKLRGKVVGLEVISKLVEYSIDILKKNYNHLYRYKRNFKILSKDGKLGHPSKKNEEIYDGIHIGAACDSIPYYLFQQLRRGGILVIPLKKNENNLIFTIVHKDTNGNIFIIEKGPVRYVPLV